MTRDHFEVGIILPCDTGTLDTANNICTRAYNITPCFSATNIMFL